LQQADRLLQLGRHCQVLAKPKLDGLLHKKLLGLCCPVPGSAATGYRYRVYCIYYASGVFFGIILKITF